MALEYLRERKRAEESAEESERNYQRQRALMRYQKKLNEKSFWEKLGDAFTGAVGKTVGIATGGLVGGPISGFSGGLQQGIQGAVKDWFKPDEIGIKPVASGYANPLRPSPPSTSVYKSPFASSGAYDHGKYTLLNFKTGGVVPGKKDEEVPIVAHGQETIFPSHVKPGEFDDWYSENLTDVPEHVKPGEADEWISGNATDATKDLSKAAFGAGAIRAGLLPEGAESRRMAKMALDIGSTDVEGDDDSWAPPKLKQPEILKGRGFPSEPPPPVSPPPVAPERARKLERDLRAQYEEAAMRIPEPPPSYSQVIDHIKKVTNGERDYLLPGEAKQLKGYWDHYNEVVKRAVDVRDKMVRAGEYVRRGMATRPGQLGTKYGKRGVTGTYKKEVPRVEEAVQGRGFQTAPRMGWVPTDPGKSSVRRFSSRRSSRRKSDSSVEGLSSDVFSLFANTASTVSGETSAKTRKQHGITVFHSLPRARRREMKRISQIKPDDRTDADWDAIEKAVDDAQELWYQRTASGRGVKATDDRAAAKAAAAKKREEAKAVSDAEKAADKAAEKAAKRMAAAEKAAEKSYWDTYRRNLDAFKTGLADLRTKHGRHYNELKSKHTDSNPLTGAKTLKASWEKARNELEKAHKTEVEQLAEESGINPVTFGPTKPYEPKQTTGGGGDTGGIDPEKAAASSKSKVVPVDDSKVQELMKGGADEASARQFVNDNPGLSIEQLKESARKAIEEARKKARKAIEEAN